MSGGMFREPEHVDPAVVANNPEHLDLRVAAAAWIEAHPHTTSLLLRFAREMAARGRRFSAKLLVERVRWECALSMSSDGEYEAEYRINNNHTAYIARWLIQADPTLEKFLRFRGVSY